MRSLDIFKHGWSGGRASINLGSSTISRVVDKGEEDPEFKPRPVGFTADIRKEETDE